MACSKVAIKKLGDPGVPIVTVACSKLTVLKGRFSTITYASIRRIVTKFVDGDPQPKWNPFKKQTTPGCIRYAYVCGPFTNNPGSYTFGRKTLECQRPNAFVEELFHKIRELTGISYDVVLINRYINTPTASLGKHMDNEAIMDADTDITSVSFVENPLAVRRLFFSDYPKDDSTAHMREYQLGHGDVTCGPYGTHYHELKKPKKTAQQPGEQLVFTFRKLKQQRKSTLIRAPRNDFETPPRKRVKL